MEAAREETARDGRGGVKRWQMQVAGEGGARCAPDRGGIRRWCSQLAVERGGNHRSAASAAVEQDYLAAVKKAADRSCEHQKIKFICLNIK